MTEHVTRNRDSFKINGTYHKKLGYIPKDGILTETGYRINSWELFAAGGYFAGVAVQITAPDKRSWSKIYLDCGGRKGKFWLFTRDIKELAAHAYRPLPYNTYGKYTRPALANSKQ